MSKQKYYTYNPITDNYERAYPTLAARAKALGKLLILSAIIGVGVFAVVYYGFGSPTVRDLREENSMLKQKYSVLEKRVDYSMKVLSALEKRDDNFYRVMLQMDPAARGQRNPGAVAQRAGEWESLSDAALVQTLSSEIDALDHRLYTQSKSYDLIKSEAQNRQRRLSHIPSVIPINVKEYTLASGYGMRRDPVYGASKFHEGLDFAAKEGTSVFATADGVIAFSGFRAGYGNCIDIDHGNNYLTRYAHLGKLEAEKGEQVKRGEMIGHVGSTGKSTAAHLHYEVRLKDVPQNPVNYYFMDLTPAQYEEMVGMAENAGHVMD